MDDMKNGDVMIFQFHPRRRETPEGWAESNVEHDTHHDQFSVLIEKKETLDATGE